MSKTLSPNKKQFLVEYKARAEKLEAQIKELSSNTQKLFNDLEKQEVAYLEARLAENKLRVAWHRCMEAVRSIELDQEDYVDDVLVWVEAQVAQTRERIRQVKHRSPPPVWLWARNTNSKDMKAIHIRRHDLACYLAMEAEQLMYLIRSQRKAEDEISQRWDDGPSYLGAAMYAMDTLLKELERYQQNARAYLGSTDEFGYSFDDDAS